MALKTRSDILDALKVIDEWFGDENDLPVDQEPWEEARSALDELLDTFDKEKKKPKGGKKC